MLNVLFVSESAHLSYCLSQWLKALVMLPKKQWAALEQDLGTRHHFASYDGILQLQDACCHRIRFILRKTQKAKSKKRYKISYKCFRAVCFLSMEYFNWKQYSQEINSFSTCAWSLELKHLAKTDHSGEQTNLAQVTATGWTGIFLEEWQEKELRRSCCGELKAQLKDTLACTGEVNKEPP